MRALLLFPLVILLAFAFPAEAFSQSTLFPLQVKVDYDYAQRLSFEIQVDASVKLAAPRLFFQVEGQPYTQQVPLQERGNGYLIAEYTALEGIPPFSYLIFWIEAERGGNTLVSPHYRFRYLDDRFPWQTRQSGNIRLSWYEGDAAFAQMMMDVAQRSVQKIEAESGLTLDAPLELYIYASGADLQNTLPYGSGWESGHASANLGVALAAITPGPNQSLVAERVIPHEILHILLYRRLGNGYGLLPLWLREGLAQMAEINPDPDAERVVRQAITEGTAIPLNELCQVFPLEAGRAYLSYAESSTFVRYLLGTYGKTSLQELLRTYAEGVSCEQGVRTVYGKSLATLEYEWRVALVGGILWQSVLRNLAPYLFILLIFLGYPLIALFRRKS
ncbi:MAG: peptidase MA family metallohydrolase [Anaerolineales bacterium]